MSAVLSEADPLKSGPRSCAYRPGVVRSDMADWRRVGRAPDLSGRKMKGVIAKTTGCPMKGSRRGLSIRLRPQRLDHPSTLGIGAEGASAYGDVSRLTPGIVAWAAELTPGTPLR